LPIRICASPSVGADDFGRRRVFTPSTTTSPPSCATARGIADELAKEGERRPDHRSTGDDTATTCRAAGTRSERCRRPTLTMAQAINGALNDAMRTEERGAGVSGKRRHPRRRVPGDRGAAETSAAERCFDTTLAESGIGWHRDRNGDPEVSCSGTRDPVRGRRACVRSDRKKIGEGKG